MRTPFNRRIDYSSRVRAFAVAAHYAQLCSCYRRPQQLLALRRSRLPVRAADAILQLVLSAHQALHDVFHESVKQVPPLYGLPR